MTGNGPVRRLRAAHADAEARIVHLERENASLRETRETLSKAAFGRKSEQQAKPRSARKRGQQRGAKGHGRTQRPSLEKKIEEHRPAPEDSVCGTCGMPHVENGYHDSELIEIEVKAHKRVLRRIRLRKACAAPGPAQRRTRPAGRSRSHRCRGCSAIRRSASRSGGSCWSNALPSTVRSAGLPHGWPISG